MSLEVDSLYADPRKVNEVDRTAKALASILTAEESEIKQRLKSRTSFEWVRRKITPREVEEIKALRQPGLFFLKENKRFYPNAQLAAHQVPFDVGHGASRA